MAIIKIEPENVNDVYTALSSNTLPKTLFDLENLKLNGLYLGIMVFYAACLAQILYHIVRIGKLDRKISILRFKNHWHYYFRGEISGFKDFKDIEIKKVGLTVADILIQTSDATTNLYKGFLRQHTINRNTGDLENVYLTSVQRYSESRKKFVEIPGDLMIFQNERIVNINLKFYPLEPNKNKVAFFPLFAFFFLIVLFFDPFRLFVGESVSMKILGRALTIFDWIFLSTFINTLFSEDKTDKAMQYARFGLILLSVSISVVIYILIQ
ncbi:hypothetical protein [Gramella sp. MAR_2010_147]|uniref:hypothetical protein n=1 Tax=Gramella sp. MAR_2010_147 TaxID=1250205 RepID=UPI0012FE46FA|nr:hypothetical protein [Gramella sp. MAR_2010_147]